MNLHHEVINPCLSAECPICFDPLISAEYLSFTNCYHKYHTKCLNEWKKKSCPNLVYNYKCPTCNELREIDIEHSLIGDNERDAPSRRGFMHVFRRCLVNLVKNN